MMRWDPISARTRYYLVRERKREGGHASRASMVRGGRFSSSSPNTYHLHPQDVIAALRAVYWRLAAEMDAKAEAPPQPPSSAPGEAPPDDDGRAGNALFLSFELEQLFEDLAVERAGPPPAESALLAGR